MSKLKVLVIVTSLILSLTMVPSVFAQETRPGWGYGDPIHVHLGPPGQSIIIEAPYDAQQIREKVRAWLDEFLANLF